MNKVIEVSINNNNELIKKEKMTTIKREINSVNIHSTLIFSAVVVIDCILLSVFMLGR